MILLVDDRNENIFSLRKVLEQHGFETDFALSGEEALKKLLRNDYALIILDVQMPGMDGFEVAEAVTGLNKTKDIPIIFLSAVSTHKKFITRGFESGGIDYLTKPVDPDILILKVRNFYSLYEKNLALRQTERSLKETVSELHGTLEALPQAAFTARPDGTIDYANKRWYDLSPSLDVMPETPAGHPGFRQAWLQSINRIQTVETEMQLRHLADNKWYHHLLKATPVISNGQLTRWVGTLTNIHQQKQLSEELERRVAERTRELLEMNRELEIINHDLQQFNFVASHDLKEPLRKIQFYGSLLKDRAALNPALDKYLDKILQSSGRMSSLISDLLTFARLSQDEVFVACNLNGIVEDIVQDLELVIREKNALIEVEPLPTIEVVPSLMRQLFMNMITNALKFAREGQTPTIRIRADVISSPSVQSVPDKQGQFCRISISDNGIGFKEEFREKIFTLFQRLHARDQYEGTGIGLAIAKKIVDKHKGVISAVGRPDEGATFIIILPLRQQVLSSTTQSTLINSQTT